MNLNLGSISNPDVRQFYANYWPQRQILHEFYALLPEEQYDYRMVDGPERRVGQPAPEPGAHSLCAVGVPDGR